MKSLTTFNQSLPETPGSGRRSLPENKPSDAAKLVQIPVRFTFTPASAQAILVRLQSKACHVLALLVALWQILCPYAQTEAATVRYGAQQIIIQPGFTPIAVGLSQGSNTLNELFGFAPSGAKLYKLRAGRVPSASNAWEEHDYISGQWVPNTTLQPGEGAIFFSPTQWSFSFAGIIPPLSLLHHPPAGYYLAGCRNLTDSAFQAMMGVAPREGDRVYRISNITQIPLVQPPSQTFVYQSNTWTGGAAPLVHSGEAVLVQLASGNAPLHMQVSPTGPNVRVSWTGGDAPFTLQSKRSLSDPAWQTVVLTAARAITLPRSGPTMFYRIALQPTPYDPVDYERDRPLTANFYAADPQSYWVHYGLPPLARLASLRESMGLEPLGAFEGVRQGFDEPSFESALAGGTLPGEFGERFFQFLPAATDQWTALAWTFRSYIGELDSVLSQQGTNAPRAGEIYQILAQVFPLAFHVEWLSPLAPQPGKSAEWPAPPVGINLECYHGVDSFCTRLVDATQAKPGDTNTSTTTAWTNITTSSIWNTTYDPACAGVAVGACAAKLGLLPNDTTCEAWNKLGHDLGCTAGVAGATPEAIASWFGAQGYSCQRPWTGLFESAAQEAKKALDRGCDVTIRYVNADGTEAHREVVTGITLDPNDSNSATVSTVSWGQGATVGYSGSLLGGGSFSGKSDGGRYRDPATPTTPSWLEGQGEAQLIYYCKD